MNFRRVGLYLCAAALLMIPAVDGAEASTLIVNSDSVVHAGPSAVTASLHLTSPSVNYSSVYVSPQFLNGTLDGSNVQLFAYCLDILHYSGAGTFNVVSLIDYLGGDTAKYNEIAAIIAAAGNTGTATGDAATQAALWEAMYENGSNDLASGTFSIDNISNDATLSSSANSLLAQAATDAGTTGSNLQLFVAENDDKQDMLFWKTSAVPEPATWGMMLLGFGGIGIAMRRRRRPGLAQIA